MAEDEPKLPEVAPATAPRPERSRPRRYSGTKTAIAEIIPAYKPIPGMGGPGRCVSCGFFSRRAANLSGVIEGVPQEHRMDNQLLRLSSGDPAMPWCLVWAFELPSEFDDHMESLDHEDGFADGPEWIREKVAIVRIATAVRNCPEWFPFRDGRTPEEHRQERDVLRLEEQRAAREERLAALEAESRRSSEQIQADSRAIAADLRAIMERADRFTTRWTKRAFWLAVAGVIVVAAGYTFPDLGRHVGEWIDRTLNYPLGRP